MKMICYYFSCSVLPEILFESPSYIPKMIESTVETRGTLCSLEFYPLFLDLNP